MTEPARQTSGWGSLASLMGAVLRGGRPEDKKVQRRAAVGTASTALVWILFELWGVVKVGILEERKEQRESAKAVIAAVQQLTSASKAQEQALVALKDAVQEQATSNQMVVGIALKQLGGPVPPAKVQPRVVGRDK